MKPVTRPARWNGDPNPASMTAPERRALELLATAWDAFVSLPDPHPCDASEFSAAIHQCQNLIAFRVARRVDPEIWNQATARTKGDERR
jgi:hypothetical protein